MDRSLPLHGPRVTPPPCLHAATLLPERRTLLRLGIGAAASSLLPLAARAQSAEVALAGLAYAGDAASLPQRFPYSLAYERELKGAGTPAYAALRDATTKAPPQKFRLVGQIDELKGRDQAVAVALVIGSETVSVEQFGGLSKLFVLMRAQTLFFDFKSMAVVRAYPISFGHIDVFDHRPTDAEIAARVRGVYEGVGGKPGIFTRFANTLTGASLPATTSRTLQVTRIALKPEATGPIPEYLRGSAAVTETWAADIVGEALSTRAGVPIVPYAKGYAVGNVMSMRISDGEVFNLRLPKADYEIGVELSALRKVKYGSAAAGESFIYGSYASVRIEEPVSAKVYLNTALKNGEVKVVPATQNYVDDFPAFYDSVNGLFVKLAEAIDGRDAKWVKSAAAAADIDKQINDTRELFKLCK
jgi:hypothetical protein